MRKLIVFCLMLCMCLTCAFPASAMTVTIDEPNVPDYGISTSIDVVYTADGGAMKNEDLSKNAALLPPAFGSAGAYAPTISNYLTPNIAPNTMAATGAIINGNSAAIYLPPAVSHTVTNTNTNTNTNTESISDGYTEVTSDLYYSGGHIGTLSISEIDLSVKVYQGTDSATLKKGVGHFEETSVWDGNVALAAHNRGVNNYFGQIHTLDIGDTIRLTTKLGSRTYEVFSVSKVSETDRSALASSSENLLTLYTCVRNQSDLRWCVQAVEK